MTTTILDKDITVDENFRVTNDEICKIPPSISSKTFGSLNVRILPDKPKTMKIAIILPSRGNHERMSAVMHCIDNLSSGQNELVYGVVADDDDEETLKELELVGNHMNVFVAGYEISKRIHTRFNYLERELGGDLTIGLCDDYFCLTQNWDKFCKHCVDIGMMSFCLQEQNDPRNTTILAQTKKWTQVRGCFCNSTFPFWFADTWEAEVYQLVYGNPLPIIADIKMGGRRGKTKGMRELSFWTEYFIKTRFDRIKDAQTVCDRLGYEVKVQNDRQKLIQMFETQDIDRVKMSQLLEEMFANKTWKKSEVYDEMKQEAIEKLRGFELCNQTNK
jgi:hypothetical protein